VNVTCPSCETVYRVDPVKVPAGGLRARCSVCSSVFTLSPDGAGNPAPVATAAAPARTAPPRPPAPAAAPAPAPARPAPPAPPVPARPAMAPAAPRVAPPI